MKILKKIQNFILKSKENDFISDMVFTLKHNWRDAIYWLVLSFLFIINSLHETFPDEYDNILGGWYVLKGLTLYKDFFTHHNPLAYWVAAGITLFSGQSFVAFRWGLAVFWFIVALASWTLIRRFFGAVWGRLYQATLLIWVVAATYYWFQMLLADSLAGFILLPILVFLTAWITQYSHRQPRLIVVLIHIGTFLLFLASQSYLYLMIALNGITWLTYLQRTSFKNWFSKSTFSLAGMVILPYLLFLGSLLINGSVIQYVQNTYEFNARYYIYNYPKEVGEIRINPVRYAIITANKVFYDYRDLLKQIPSLPMHNPMNIAAMLVVSSLLVLSLHRKQYLLSLVILAGIVLTNFRSSPLDSTIHDFQAAGYWAVVYWCAVCWFVQVRHELNSRLGGQFSKLVFGSLTVLSGFFVIASVATLVFMYEQLIFGKYMGTIPLVYDRPLQAPLINKFVPVEEKVWVGPFHFEDQFYLKNSPASAYTILLPEFKYDQRIQSEIISDLEENKPYLISIDTDFSVRGGNPFYDAEFFYNYLPTKYTKLEWSKRDGKSLVSLVDSASVHILEDWWIRTDVLESALDRLVELEYVKFE